MPRLSFFSFAAQLLHQRLTQAEQYRSPCAPATLPRLGPNERSFRMTMQPTELPFRVNGAQGSFSLESGEQQISLEPFARSKTFARLGDLHHHAEAVLKVASYTSLIPCPLRLGTSAHGWGAFESMDSASRVACDLLKEVAFRASRCAWRVTNLLFKQIRVVIEAGSGEPSTNEVPYFISFNKDGQELGATGGKLSVHQNHQPALIMAWDLAQSVRNAVLDVLDNEFCRAAEEISG